MIALKIHKIGFDHRHGEDFRIDRPYGSGDCLFLLVKTPVVFTFEGSDTFFQSGSFILYTKDVPQYYRAAGVPFANDWCHFELTEEDMTYLAELNIPLNKAVLLPDITEGSALMNSLSREFFSENSFKEQAAELYLKLIFTKIARQLHSDELTGCIPYYSRLSELRSEIYNMPAEEWSADIMAKRLSLSKSYFQHIYSRAFGISPANDIIRSRTEYAKYLLSGTDMAVSKIAEMCGYKCLPHFIRQFKSRTGSTPAHFRNVGTPIR